MTKKSAFAVSRDLGVKCDEPYMFAVKIGAGCLCDIKTKSDGWVLLTLFINLLERTMTSLKRHHQDTFRALLINALQRYLEDDRPVISEEILSNKQLAKRIKNNDRIISELEYLLENHHA